MSLITAYEKQRQEEIDYNAKLNKRIEEVRVEIYKLEKYFKIKYYVESGVPTFELVKLVPNEVYKTKRILIYLGQYRIKVQHAAAFEYISYGEWEERLAKLLVDVMGV